MNKNLVYKLLVNLLLVLSLISTIHTKPTYEKSNTLRKLIVNNQLKDSKFFLLEHIISR